MVDENRLTSGGLLLVGGRLCLDFCNTVERVPQHDMLATNGFRSLVRWGGDVGALDDVQVEHLREWGSREPQKAAALFDDAITLREAIYNVCRSVMENTDTHEDALATINRWSAQTFAARELHPNGKNFEWRWRDAPEMLLWKVTASAGEMLMGDDLHRLRQCPGCGWLFYDQSRNNRRTWCDMRYCGNRAKNKRFHARKKQN